jgi:putative addiction module CopG family antidote
MSEPLPPDIQQFVDQQLAAGRYASQQDLVVSALRFFRDSHARLEEIRTELRGRLARLSGQGAIELEDDEALGRFLDEIEAEVQADLGSRDEANR